MAIVVMIGVMAVKPVGNGRPRNIAHSASCGCADRSADDGSGLGPHQSLVQPFSGRRLRAGLSSSVLSAAERPPPGDQLGGIDIQRSHIIAAARWTNPVK